MKKSTRKWLLFTSAGDNSNVQQWLAPDREYDVFVVYYGDGDFKLKNQCDFFEKRKGGKYQNIHHFYQQDKSFFECYEAILIFDDDIEISTKKLNSLFHLREKKGLDLLQASYDRRGKISHKITEFNPTTSLRFINFVENGVPIFSLRAFVLFFNVYDPYVNTTGVDWWFCYLVEKNFGTKTIAISDDITCLNPHDKDKDPSGIREIDKFLSREQRNKTWREVKAKHGLDFPEDVFRQYASEGSVTVYKLSFWIYTKIADIFLRAYRKLK